MSKRPPTPEKINSSSHEKKPATLKPKALTPASYSRIQQAGGSCWTGLLICQKCQMKPTSYYVDNWLMELHCSNCNNRYQVYTLCSSNRKQFFSFNDVKKYANQHSHQKRTNQRMFFISIAFVRTTLIHSLIDLNTAHRPRLSSFVSFGVIFRHTVNLTHPGFDLCWSTTAS